MGFPHTPFLTVAANIPLYRQLYHTTHEGVMATILLIFLQKNADFAKNRIDRMEKA